MKHLITLFLLPFGIIAFGQLDTKVELSNHFRKVEVTANAHSSKSEFFLQEDEVYLSAEYGSNTWAAGKHPSGDIKFTAANYPEAISMYVPGPLNEFGVAFQNPFDCFDRVWKVYGADLINHKKAFLDGELLIEKIPVDILEWPAIGNPFFSIGSQNGDILSQELAPFYDHNSDGIYNVFDGDLPIFNSGVEFETIGQVWSPFVFAFTIYNDSGPQLFSDAGRVGLEVRQSIYMFQCEDDEDFNNSIFTNHHISYKGNVPLTDFRFAFWKDSDLACFIDDFHGSLPEYNSTFTYNSVPIEDVCIGNPYFPYDFGLVSVNTVLNHDLKAFMVNASPTVDTIDQAPTPITPFDFLNYICGRWSDGVPVTTGGNGFNQGSIDTTLFMFHDPPDEPDGWSMINEELQNSNYRTISSLNLPSVILPNQEININSVNSVLMDRDVYHLEIFEGLEDRIVSIRNKHNDMLQLNNPNTSCGVFCETNCVWPGDVDRDDIVGPKDFLYLGAVQGKGWSEGPSRSFPGDAWNPFFSTEWDEQLLGVNGRTADANGNGRISDSDYLTCQKNFYQTTYNCQSFENENLFEDLASGYKIKFENSSASSSSTLQRIFFFSIEFDPSTIELQEGFHGVAFDVVFDTSLVSASYFFDSVNEDYFQDTGYAGYFFNGERSDVGLELIGDDRISFVFTSKGGVNQFPDEKLIEKFSLMIKSDAATGNISGSQSTSLKIENSFIIDADGIPLEPIGYSSESIRLDGLQYDSTIVSHTTEDFSFIETNIFPNPSNLIFQVETDLNTSGYFDLIDLNGRQVKSMKVDNLSFNQVSVDGIKSGVYILKIYNTRKKILAVEKIIVTP